MWMDIRLTGIILKERAACFPKDSYRLQRITQDRHNTERVVQYCQLDSNWNTGSLVVKSPFKSR